MRLVLYIYFIYFLSPYMWGHTDGQQTLHEPNGSITTAWDTPDDGPKKAQNM
jgi:hypothetical protein